MSNNHPTPSPIGDKVNPEKKAEPIKANEARPQTLKQVKKWHGITLVGDYFDDKFGRA